MQNRFLAIPSLTLLIALTAMVPMPLKAEEPAKPAPVNPDKKEDKKDKAEKPAPAVSASVNANFPGGKIYSRLASGDANALPAENPVITSANGTFGPFSGGNQPTSQTSLRSIAGTSQRAVVQVALDSDQVAVYLRAARNFEEKLQVIQVVDDKNTATRPSGYMLQKGEKLLIKLGNPNSINLISEIKAMDEVKKGDTLYLIFHAPKNATLVKFVAANKTATMNLAVK